MPELWVNGELLFARDEYHRKARVDQFVIEGKLKKGENQILVKVCQMSNSIIDKTMGILSANHG